MKDKNGAEHSEQNGRFVSSNSGEKKEYGNLPSAKRLASNYNKHFGTSKMTPDEKIASVHIDFSKDNILPELNESELEKVGVKDNKPILLKKSVIERNRTEHSDLTNEDFEQIVANALYAPSEVFPANKEKPYYHFAKVIEVNSKGKPEIGLALLDVDERKDNFEIVHAHFVRSSSYETMKRKK